MRRVKVESVASDGFGLSTKEHHYVANVLRQAPGAELELFDGTGNVVRARLEEAGQVTVLCIDPYR